jgi:hypothetical protein
MSDSHQRLPARRIEPEARERVAHALAHNFAADHLDADELESRLTRVYAATTPAELESIVADLPAVAQASDAAVVPAKAPEAHRISALFSAQEQRLTGAVPRRIELRGSLGYIELDLTQATFEPGLTEIDVRALMGYVEIRFPPGVRVESGGHALFGFFSLKGGSGNAQSPSVVKITGRATFGYAEFFVKRDKKALPPTSE